MKLLDKIHQIISSYDLKPIDIGDYKNIYKYLNVNPYDSKRFQPALDDHALNVKYSKYIPDGWYGFSIGTPIIPEWVEIIDKVLELCIENDNKFEIHQIKLKFGGISFYCESNIIEDLNDIEILISDELYDKALIY